MKLESFCQRPSIAAFCLMMLLGLLVNLPTAIAGGHLEGEKKAHQHETKVEKQTQTALTYTATKDFDYKIKDYSHSYINGDYLAVDPIVYETKPAAATRSFDGADGTYDVTITTLAEFDGESQYTLIINDAEKGTVQTGRVKGREWEVQQQFTWENIKIKNGDTITILSTADSNGIYPEEGAPGGFAWSRARWSKIEFNPS